MKECVSKKGIDNIKVCVNLPLINVEPKYCVVDELHLFLRITDILYEFFFAELHRLDHKAKTFTTGSDHRVIRATRMIRRKGISLNVWLSKYDSSRKSRSGIETSTLNRNEKLKVLKFLLESFDDLLPNNVAVPLAKLWVVSDCEIVYNC